MTKDFVQKLKEQIQLYDIVSRKVRLQRAGQDWLGLCPFHKEKTPSFRVLGSGQYHCFGCGAHGDAITFIEKTENLDFSDAVKFLADLYHIPIPKRHDEVENPLKPLYETMEKIAECFKQQLRAKCGENARNYLLSRNVSEESIEKFQLGFAPDNDELLRYLRREGISDEILIKSGVFIQGSYGPDKLINRYNGRLIFPIFDTYSRCVGFGGRILDKSAKAKYINSPETEIFSKRDLLYGYSVARRSKSRQVILVEGYLDVIAMHQAGFDGTVAPLGTSIHQSQINTCWRICDFPIICLDGDKAGITSAYRWIDRIFESLIPGKSFRFALLPENTDPDILISSGRKSVLEDVINDAVPLSQWLWNGAFALYPSETPEQKASVIKMLLEKTDLIPDKSLKQLYVQDIKSREAELYRTVYKKGKIQKKTISPQNVVPVVSLREKFEKIFLVILINHPYILDEVIEDFVKIDMKMPQTKALQQKIIDAYNFADDNDDFSQRASELRELIRPMEQDVILHAKFVSKEASDAEALAGWRDAMNSFLAQPELLQDLQKASFSLQSSFSDDDWQRLKALKKEGMRNKWKI